MPIHIAHRLRGVALPRKKFSSRKNIFEIFAILGGSKGPPLDHLIFFIEIKEGILKKMRSKFSIFSNRPVWAENVDLGCLPRVMIIGRARGFKKNVTIYFWGCRNFGPRRFSKGPPLGQLNIVPFTTEF